MCFYLQLFLLAFLSLSATAQKKNDSLHIQNQDKKIQSLITEYLSSTHDAEDKIQRLLKLAAEDADKQNFEQRMEKIQIALILEKYAEPCENTFELNFTMGNIFRDINLKYAIEYYNKAITIGKSTSEKTDMFAIHNILAGLYLKLNDNSQVLRSYGNAMTEAVKLGTVAASSVNNNIGWFYSKTGNDDSAMIYFKKAAAYYSESTTDDDLYSNIQENIAKVNERRGNYSDALKTYLLNEQFYKRLNAIGDLISNSNNILRVKSKLNKPGIKKCIDSLSSVIDNNEKLIDPQDVLRFYKFSYEYFINKQDIKSADFYLKKYDRLKDILVAQDIQKANTLTNALLNVQSRSFKNEYDVYRAELYAAKQSSFKNKIIAFLFLISAILMFILLTFFTRKRKRELELTKKMSAAELKTKELEAKSIKAELENERLHSEAEIQKKDIERRTIENEFEKERLITKAELERKDLESRTMQNELELKKKDLTNVILLNTQVYESNKEMIDRLHQLSQEEDFRKSLKILVTDLKSKNQLGERLGSLQHNIDHLNTEFYQKLKQKFPNLTRAEIELCGYVLINLSNKDVAVLKNVEPASVKMSKTRLRKKLGINPDEDLLNFIKSL